jgi:hypothetical protein
MQGISCIAEQLFPSQEGIYFVELLTRHTIDYLSSNSCNFFLVYYAYLTEMTFSNEFLNILDFRAEKINLSYWATDIVSGNIVRKSS